MEKKLSWWVNCPLCVKLVKTPFNIHMFYTLNVSNSSLLQFSSVNRWYKITRCFSICVCLLFLSCMLLCLCFMNSWNLFYEHWGFRTFFYPSNRHSLQAEVCMCQNVCVLFLWSSPCAQIFKLLFLTLIVCLSFYSECITMKNVTDSFICLFFQ